MVFGRARFFAGWSLLVFWSLVFGVWSFALSTFPLRRAPFPAKVAEIR